MKHSFLKGMILGVTAGTVMGVMFDPMTKCEKKAIKKKIGRLYDEMMD